MGQYAERVIRINVTGDAPHALEVLFDGVYVGMLDHDGVIQMDPAHEDKREYLEEMFSMYLHQNNLHTNQS